MGQGKVRSKVQVPGSVVKYPGPVWQSARLQVGLGESVGIWRAPGQKNNDPKP